jgi:hypothetical protein
MMRNKLIAIVILILSQVQFSRCEDCNQAILPKKVSSLIMPLLKESILEHNDMFGDGTIYLGDSNHTVKVHSIFRKLSKNKTKEADEALVALTWFYLGEDLGEQLNCVISERGPRMGQYLKKYEKCNPLLSFDFIPIKLLITPHIHSISFSRIKLGEKCEYE